MSFYRTYRPQVIEEIDNASVKAQLLHLFQKGKKGLPHAFLFSGPRGAGKTTAARLIAKMLNCTKPAKAGPCGACEQCVSIAQGRNLDVLEIDAASNRGIDEIRLLREAVGLAPASATYKVYIIDEVHMLTTEAFNALLKTLEEPPQHVVFVLATTDPQKVPVTIKSRCMAISFSKASQDELRKALGRIKDAEKLHIDEDALLLITTFADGSFRDAVKLLEQLSLYTTSITKESVYTYLPVTDSLVETKFIDSLAKRNAQDALRIVESLVKEGRDIRAFLGAIFSKIHELLTTTILDPSKSHDWSVGELQRLTQALSFAYSEMKSSPIPQLPLELAVVEFCEEKSGSPEVVSADHSVKPGASGASASKKAQGEPLEPIMSQVQQVATGLLTLAKLKEHWSDVIAELKPYNHSVAGVMRSTRPMAVDGGIVTVEAFYSFHKEKLSEPKTKDMLAGVLKKLFGEKVRVEVVLGKK